LVVIQEKTMITKTTLAIIVAITTVGIASPVLAQSRDRGEDAYAMVPPFAANSAVNNPAITGGGSVGYNDTVLKGQW
jgi:hypothetical protein